MIGPTPFLAFDGMTEDARRASGSLKWTRYGSAIGAFVAEMDFGTAQLRHATPRADGDGRPH